MSRMKAELIQSNNGGCNSIEERRGEGQGRMEKDGEG